MTQRNYSSTAVPTTLNAGIAANPATDTSVNVASVAGYPPPPFTAAIDRGQVNEECVLVIAGPTSTTWGIQRGYDGTTVSSHSIGAQFEHCVAAIDFREANTHIQATGAHGVGTVVGTTEAQTLSNKVLIAPTIADFTGATHDHGTAAKGGYFPYAKGVVARSYWDADSATTTSTETPLTSVTYTSEPGRRYKFWTSVMLMQSTVAADITGLRMRMTNGSGVDPSAARMAQAGIYVPRANVGDIGASLSHEVEDSYAGQRTVGVFFVRLSGTGTIKVIARPDVQAELVIEDVGPI